MVDLVVDVSEDVAALARQLADARGTTVSQMFSDWVNMLNAEEDLDEQPDAPRQRRRENE